MISKNFVNMIKRICELVSTDSPDNIYCDIKVIQKGCISMTNKLLVHLKFPYLLNALEFCDLVIIDSDSSFESENIQCQENVTTQGEKLVSETEISKSNTICDICGKKFPSLLKLNKHIKNCHSFQGECNICKKVFCNQGTLSNHIKTHSETFYPCPICGMQFKHERFINTHIKNSHYGTLQICTICNKNFSSLYNLKRHLKLH